MHSRRTRTIARLALIALVAATLATLAPQAAAPVAADGNEAPGAPLAFRSITAGGYHTCALLPSGAVKCWGYGDNGQLGQGSTDNLGDEAGEMAGLAAVNLGAGRTATAVTAGIAHTCALLDDATVKCWGSGGSGQLGQGSTTSLGDQAGEMAALAAVNLGAGRTATAVTAGDSHTCALLDDGTVKCWGYGADGQLGQGSTTSLGDQAGEMAALAAVNLGAGRTATAVTAGNYHTCAVLDNATVKCWGYGGTGALGQGSTTNLGDQPGEMAALPAVNLGSGRTATAVTAGAGHTCALLDNATVKCWGQGGNGQLGQDSTARLGDVAGEMAALAPVNLGAGRTATAVSAGQFHTCALLDDATVKCWGYGADGQLGQGSTTSLGDVAGEMAALAPVNLGAGRTATAVTAGEAHTCALLDDATVKCWGYGADGQLGQGSTTSLGDQAGEMAALAAIVLVPLRVALSADQARVGPGEAIDYHLTITNNSAATLTGITITDPDAPACVQAVPDLAPGQSHTVDCSYTTSDADYPSRANTATVDTDQTAPVSSNSVNVAVDLPFTATAVTAGDSHTCAVLDNATVKCWGYNGSGQLGQGSTAQLGDQAGEMAGLPAVNLGSGRTATAVTAGAHHTCALLDNATVKCWGNNALGQLGQGSTASLGDQAGEMAGLAAVNLGAGRTATAVSAGTSHTCALLDNATVKCWGANGSGQLGQDSTAKLGDQPGEMAGLAAVNLGAGRTATAVSAGAGHTCALLDNASVKCWGHNFSGQLGQDSNANLGDQAGEMAGLPAVNLGAGRTATAITAGGEHTCALLDNDTVKCWGLNDEGQLGQGSTASLGDGAGEMAALPAVNLGAGRTATAVNSGSNHTCALLDDATVKCWGQGGGGQLGQGSIANRGDQPGEMSALAPVNLGAGRTATAITGGHLHTCALLDDATVKCWGANGEGQLGQDSTAQLGDQPGEMAALPAVNLGFGSPGRASMSVTLAADETTVVAGGTIHYHLTVTNTGVPALSGFTVSDPNAPDCVQPIAGLASGAQETIDCTYTTTGADVGTYANTATVDTTQTAPVESNSVTVAVDLPFPATAVAAGAYHTCALLDDATVKCWGQGADGQLGQDSTARLGDGAGEMAALAPVNLGAGRTATAVAAGNSHTCALLDDATVKCWGYGGSGQLGQGSTANRGDQAGEMAALAAVNLGAGRTATAVTAGGGHTCALLDDATVKCWGQGTDGQLGQDSTARLGDGAGEMAGLAAVNLGAGRTATAVTAGNSHTCALLDDATVKCWGYGADGQLGQDSTARLGDGAGEMAALPAVNLGAGRTATAVTAGSYHTCALLDDATVKCWGEDSSGRLGQGSTDNLGDDAGEMAALAPVNLGSGRTATAVTAGGNHTCALLDDATVKCWGLNNLGQLGQDSTASLGDQPGEMAGLPAVNLGAGRTATAVTAGIEHTCALLDDATVKCWGRGGNGQLGQGSIATLGDEPGEMAGLAPVNLGRDRPATFTVALTADETAVVAGESIHYHLTVTNTGVLALSGFTVSDPNAPDCEQAIADLTAGAHQTIDCTYTTTGADVGTYANTATVDTAETAPKASNTVNVTVTEAPVPALSVVKSVDETSVVAGDTVHLHVRVENIGDVALTDVTIDDPNGPDCEVAPFDLAVGEDVTVDCEYVATAGDVPTYENTASVTATEVPTAVVSNTVTVTVTIPAGDAHVSGTVTEQGSGDPIPGAVAAVLSPVDFSPVAIGTADAAGHFSALADPGSYYVYVLDPGGDHAAAFHGAPSLVAASADSTAAADTALASTRGTISGEVTDDGTGDPLAGVLAINVDLDSGVPGAGDLTDSDGAYAITGLRPGPKLVEFVDLTGGHRPEFFDDVPTPAGSSVVSVVGASEATADAGLAAQTAPTGGAHLEGQVTSTTGVPLAGVAVFAVHTADFSLGAGVLTDSAGHYDLDLDAGTYKVAFYDPAGAHGFEWFDDQGPNGLGDAATVTATAGTPTTVDTALTPTTGTASGTVTETGTGVLLADVGVFAIDANGTTVAATTTAGDGTYTLAGLPAGDHRVRFVDLTGAHTSEYHLDAPDYDAATPLAATAGGTVTGIDAALTLTA